MSRARSGPTGWSTVEERICEDLTLPLQHEPDGGDSWDWYDATLMRAVEQTLTVPIRGPRFLPAGTRVEIKTCKQWISNGDKRRRGRWTIHSRNHRRRVQTRSAYLFVIRDAEEAILAAADWVDRVFADRWTTGDNDHPGQHTLHLGWPLIIPKSRLQV